MMPSPRSLLTVPFVSVHAAHHRLYRRIEDMTGRLGIEARHQLERALHIGEQHRDELAFALQRTTAGPDDFREMLGRMVDGQVDGIFRRNWTSWPHHPAPRWPPSPCDVRPHGQAELLEIVLRGRCCSGHGDRFSSATNWGAYSLAPIFPSQLSISDKGRAS